MDTQTFTKPVTVVKNTLVEHKGKSITVASLLSLIAAIAPLYTGQNSVHCQIENTKNEEEYVISSRWQEYQDNRLEDIERIAKQREEDKKDIAAFQARFAWLEGRLDTLLKHSSDLSLPMGNTNNNVATATQ